MRGMLPFNRRIFLSAMGVSVAMPELSFAQSTSQKVALYANVGADLTRYDVDLAGAELTKRETVTLPAAVQYAWPHASRRYLYVASSSSVLQRRPWCCGSHRYGGRRTARRLRWP